MTVPPMSDAPKLTTTLSTKGQVILPASIRRRQHWNAGTRLTVEETADGDYSGILNVTVDYQ